MPSVVSWRGGGGDLKGGRDEEVRKEVCTMDGVGFPRRNWVRISVVGDLRVV